ncbi:MAG: hypothetical protein PUC18_05760 [Prevotellaceae bacterium]|nr:hypothetical protein [Prevotellaceae bacterium]
MAVTVLYNPDPVKLIYPPLDDHETSVMDPSVEEVASQVYVSPTHNDLVTWALTFNASSEQMMKAKHP